MKPCPCINCLIFPICKAKVNEHMKNWVIINPNKIFDRIEGFNIYNILEFKCGLIRHWIDSKFITNIEHKRFAMIYRLYK